MISSGALLFRSRMSSSGAAWYDVWRCPLDSDVIKRLDYAWPDRGRFVRVGLREFAKIELGQFGKIGDGDLEDAHLFGRKLFENLGLFKPIDLHDQVALAHDERRGFEIAVAFGD